MNAEHESLGSLERTGMAMSAFGALGLLVFPFLVGRTFAAMFRDLGNRELPTLTELAISTWYPLALALIAIAGVSVGFVRTQPMARRRIAILVACVASTVGAITCIIGVYLPIFSLAGQIKAQ